MVICLFFLSCLYYCEYEWLVNVYSINKLLSVTLAYYQVYLKTLLSQKKYYKYWGVALPPPLAGGAPWESQILFAARVRFIIVPHIVSAFPPDPNRFRYLQQIRCLSFFPINSTSTNFLTHSTIVSSCHVIMSYPYYEVDTTTHG